MTENLFLQRLRLLRLLFYVCLAVLFVRALQLGAFSREKYLQLGDRISRRQITLPPRRGEIRDKNNVRLVWNERQFDLLPNGKLSKKRSLFLQNELKKLLPERSFRFDQDQPVCTRLTMSELSRLEPLLKNSSALRVRSQNLRQRLDHPLVLSQAGAVVNGKGTSGWESKYDETLSGSPGTAFVTLDRRQNWVPGSWQLIQAPRHGANVILPLDIKKEKHTPEIKK